MVRLSADVSNPGYFLITVVLAAAMVVLSVSCGDESSSKFGYEEFFLVPVRAHLIQSRNIPQLSTKLRSKDVILLMEKVNEIYSQAGVHFYLESIWQEPAGSESILSGFKTGIPLNMYLFLRPEQSLDQNLVHLYYVHELPVNGLTILKGEGGVFINDSARLVDVKGGTDDTLSRVTSHELGHVLGMTHTVSSSNLMNEGTSGFQMDEVQVEVVRNHIQYLKNYSSTGSFFVDANAKFKGGQEGKSKSYYEILVSIAGESPIKYAAEEKLLEIEAIKN